MLANQKEEPLAAYREKLKNLRSDFESATRRTRIFGTALVTAAALLFTGLIIWGPRWPLAAPLLLAAFALRRLQDSTGRSRTLYRLRGYYETGIARLERDWDMLPGGEEYRDPTHLYAADLSLFGRGSLYQLLCSARTRAGRDTLARWMKQSAPIEECRARAEAVRELRRQVDLREALAAAGPSSLSDFRTETFSNWAQSTQAGFPAWARWAALGLSGAVLTIAATCLAYWSPRILANPYVASTLGLEAGFALLFAARARAVINSTSVPSTELPVVCEVVRILENRRFSALRLAGLSERLGQGSSSASRELGRLLRLITLLNLRNNPWFELFSYALLWGTQFGMAIDLWRRRHGAQIVPWLETVGEFEALISLAAYADEHPGDVFPEFMETDGPALEAQGIGHPLLDEHDCVYNDFALGGDAKFVVISGSNMSGKSTFLRAVALNAVLARMGAPVRCGRLRLSDLQVGASILVQDSLAEGRSHFLAEVDRLRQIIQAAKQGPLLFVIDEILIGTNSHDRAVVAEWVVRALLKRGAVGLISTHDLALTAIAESPQYHGTNYHFADKGDPAGLEFDHRLRSGVVARSNALSIARSLGIETGE